MPSTLFLSEIATDIARKYLLRALPPAQRLPSGLLDYRLIRNEPINTNVLHRVIDGYTSACRLAALIQVLFEFYKKNKNTFLPSLQKEIDAITPSKLQEIKVVALMSTTGRTKVMEKGSKYRKQGKKECLAYLKEMISDANERERLANSIIECDRKNKNGLSLASCLLSDATMLEDLQRRDDSLDKGCSLTRFAFMSI